MKKLFPLLLLLLLSCTFSFAQDTPVKRTEEYCELHLVDQGLLTYKFSGNVDYGLGSESLKDANGKRIEFKSPVAALNHMNGLGWELRDIRTVREGSDSRTFYIFSRKL